MRLSHGPTPIKSGLITTDACVFVKNIVYPQLKDDINRSMQGLLGVEEFVKAVWGFDEADLRWDEWMFKPSAKLQAEFRVPDEVDRYKPFCDMLDDAFDQWCKLPGPIRKRTVQLVPKEALAGLAEKEISTVAGVITWNGMPIVGEFKKWLIAQLQPPKPGSPMSAPELHPVDVFSSAGMKRRREMSADGPVKRQKSEHKSQPLATIQDLDLDEVTTQPGSEIFHLEAETKLTPITRDQIQLAGYANEIFAAVGNRRYVTGLFVRGDKVSLWYYDRIGVVRTKEFSILDPADSKLVVLMAVAMSVCDRDHLGFEPLLHPPTNVVSSSTVKDNILLLPANHTIDGSGVQVQHDVSFQVLGNKAIYIQYGVIGRGTVVYSVAAKDTGGLELPKGELVAKLSWPVKTRAAEDFLICDIRSKIGPTWSKHIPELICSMTLDGDALGLPRTLMPSLDDASEERVLRILIAPRAEALAKARSLEEFQAIFLHVHLYRHDLESFIYVLVWCAMHLRLDGTEQSRHPLLNSWTEGTWDNIYQAKYNLFSNFKTLDPIFRNIQPAFQPILPEWIVPLCELLKDIQQQQSNHDDNIYGKIWKRKAKTAAQQANEDAWNETREGLMTFENFMTMIGEDPDIPELAASP
ncbi:hypothetical protein EWM64_g7685 [Hericium alpestre]|uniref:Fungal-type protein kinase domain-containing protein n=1 Tax=Hericium alpestre TaxID=135208 RepID=A0A4Y9ZQJ5_9AGAM|nr:hypothetical protein EWM64_g7685 [Hericium alpestre]